ncbi:MAG: DUF222 domain-containing protein [Terrimesophilobacter sp.]
MSTFAQKLVDSASAVANFGVCSGDFDSLTDEQLMSLGVAIAAHDRVFGLVRAQHAAQVARRSRRELGHSGLAARNGFASAQKFLQELTKVTAREATQLVAVGTAIGETEAATTLLDSGVTDIGGVPVALPWDSPISRAVTAGTLSVDGADAMRRGLGTPSDDITGRMLGDCAVQLLCEKSKLSPDRMFTAARLERELMDLNGIQARQQELYDRGGLKFYPQPDGMWRLSGQVDPEAAAILTTALDPYTSPRRGGPRFRRPDDIVRAQAIIDDPRTTERLALDGLLELVALGAAVDPAKMQPKLRTLVKIVTTVDTACVTGGESDVHGDRAGGGGSPVRGFGVLESNRAMISAASVQRALCDGEAAELTVDRDGNPLDLGRTSRLFDRRQREALAVRDGGCLWPECDRPPGFTEAHHTKHWSRDHGRTNIDDGVLLCRFHHLQLHNNRWEIGRRGSNFWLTPPRTLDAEQVPIKLMSRSPLIAHLRRTATG